jgi:LruC domain-containing protein
MASMTTPSRLLLLTIAAFFSISAPLNSARAGMLLFEDLWPSNGDLDFNDQVIAYNYSEKTNSTGQVTNLQATFNVLAVGSTLHNGLYLHLPIPASEVVSATLNLGQGAGPVTVDPVSGESDLVIPLAADTRSLFGNPTGFINTTPGTPTLTAPTITFDLQLASPAALTGDAPFDLFIARTSDYGHQIHLPQYGGTSLVDSSLFDTGDDNSSAATGTYYVNKQGVPFALNVPQTIPWPTETTPIDLAYPDIDAYFASGGTQHTDWYLTDVNPQYLYSSVPEPRSFALMAIGTVGFAARRGRRLQLP